MGPNKVYDLIKDLTAPPYEKILSSNHTYNPDCVL